MLLASPRANAHALLVSAVPADGVSLRDSPATVSLAFTEEPDEKLSRLDVLDATGRSYVTAPAVVVPGKPRSLRAEISDLPEGVYTVTWRVLSRVDGHYTAGAYAFGVRVDPSEIEGARLAAATAPPLSPLEAAGRFIIYIGLVAVVGLSWTGVVLFGKRRAAGRPLLIGTAVTLAGLVLLAIAQATAADAALSDFLSSSIGRAVIARFVLIAIIAGAVALAIALAAPASSQALVLVVIAGLATIGVHASAGHAATGSFAWLKVATQLVHFSAAAIWIGGLAALLLGVRGAPDEEKARAVRRFSVVAGAGLAVVVGTGTARAVAEVGSWDGLISTAYGRIVLAKIALVGVISALAARNRWKNVPESSRSLTGLRRVSRGELSVGAGVLALTAVLSSLTPARSASLAEPTSELSLSGSDFARNVRVRLTITPGFPGANEFRAEVDVLRGPRAEGVTLRLSSQEAGVEGVRVELDGTGELWEARSAAVALPGNWRLVVIVDRGADSVEVPLAFHTRCRTEPPTSAGPPRLYDIEIGESGSVQGYADPGRAGSNQVHFTFFDPAGKELPMADAPTIVAFSPERDVALGVRRFSAGHFVGEAMLSATEWIFEFEGQTERGESLTVCFEDEIT